MLSLKKTKKHNKKIVDFQKQTIKKTIRESLLFFKNKKNKKNKNKKKNKKMLLFNKTQQKNRIFAFLQNKNKPKNKNDNNIICVFLQNKKQKTKIIVVR